MHHDLMLSSLLCVHAVLQGVNLALSLHAPTQELRKRIVPSARAYPLHKLMDTIAEYQAATQQRVFVEYVMLAGVNDSVEQAHALGQLLQGNDILLNLLPWNPVYSPDGPHYAAPSAGRVQEFQSIVRSQYGIHCTVRQKKGQDIAGACGQLVIQHGQQGGSCSIEAAAPGGKDIEELVAAAGPTTAAS
eukprot:GHRR01020181.1.p1 GENE.GHRR01020181.1~~GHRR01020181.1.p1  ORF type:complete len:189 (+),score=64.06 GHRR01020181.1:777-1343(+)